VSIANAKLGFVEPRCGGDEAAQGAPYSYELKLDGCHAIGVKAVLGSRGMRADPVGEVPR
jgi:hypothetical protein